LIASKETLAWWCSIEAGQADARGEQKLRSLSRIHLDELSAAAPALAKILRSFKAKTR
jgi:hypothetical protein